jgi:hypothetical protein
MEDRRLVALEERYTRLEESLRELFDASWDQARTITRLEARVAELERGALGGPAPNEKPPHF